MKDNCKSLGEQLMESRRQFNEKMLNANNQTPDSGTSTMEHDHSHERNDEHNHSHEGGDEHIHSHEGDEQNHSHEGGKYNHSYEHDHNADCSPNHSDSSSKTDSSSSCNLSMQELTEKLVQSEVCKFIFIILINQSFYYIVM